MYVESREIEGMYSVEVQNGDKSPLVYDVFFVSQSDIHVFFFRIIRICVVPTLFVLSHAWRTTPSGKNVTYCHLCVPMHSFFAWVRVGLCRAVILFCAWVRLLWFATVITFIYCVKCYSVLRLVTQLKGLRGA